MQASTTITELAGEAYGWFTTKENHEGERIVVLKDDAPEWVTDLVREAHGEFLPDDWRFSSIRSALGAIHDDGASQDLDDLGSEWADGNVDVYTHARLKWLASNLNRPAYVDDARSEGLVGPDADITDAIGVGQYMESREVFYAVSSSLEKLADES